MQTPTHPATPPDSGLSSSTVKASESTVSKKATADGVANAMARVEAAYGEHFPELLNAMKAALATVAVGALADNSQPTAVILVGPPSSGKTEVLRPFMPRGANDALNKHFYRSDKFTAQSFVSHRADLSNQQLQQVDLLPKLKGKTLITKELSPVFRGKRDDLTERFSVLTTVLDGEGFTSDSGSKGQRGYSDPINFQWLGATTPFEPEAVEVIGTLGPRLNFYNVERERRDVGTLARQALKARNVEGAATCREAVREYLDVFFAAYPPGTASSDSVNVNEKQMQLIVCLALALIRLRANQPAAGEPFQPEYPERTMQVLRNLAIGSALAHGRTAVNDYDLAQVRHIALSSGTWGRQAVLRTVIENGGKATTPEIARLTAMSEPPARKYMEELDAIGLVRLTKGSPYSIELLEEFQHLLEAPLLKAKRSEGGGTESQKPLSNLENVA